MDNTAAVSYLNYAEGTRSQALSDLAIAIWEWCLQRRIYLSAIHIPGIVNKTPDGLSHQKLESIEWMLDSSVFSSDSGCLLAASSGSLCFSPQPSTRELFFLDPGSTGYGNRCFQHSMEIQSVLPVSSISSHSEMYSEHKTGSDRCIAHNASLEISTMVPSFTRNADGPTSTITSSCQITSPSNVPISSSPINRKENQSSRLACVEKSLKSEGFLKRCPKYCFPPGDPVQRNITNQHGNHLIAGVLKNRKIRFLAL